MYALKVKSAVNAFQSFLPSPSAVVDEAVQVSLLCCFCFLACHVTVAVQVSLLCCLFVFLPVM
jgi:hypothetical protein